MALFKDEKIITTLPAKKRDAMHMVIAFPNTYSIGMASLGYQTAWKLFNQNEDVSALRWFTDIQEPCRGVACYVPQYVGFSFSWELDYKNIFYLLEKNNIPLYSSERSENDPIVFCGGQVPNANPEPFCENFDFFLLGDLEEIAEPFINKIIETRDLSREEKLNALAELPGVYVPYTGVACNAPTFSKRQTTRRDLTYSSILTPNSVWPNTFIVEVARGCPELCRFCLASYGSLPFRMPDLKKGLIPIVDFGLKHTNKIGLLGASVTQHPEFEGLIEHLLHHKAMPLQVQIASVRADTISKNLAEGLHKLGAKSITMAVETGSQKLRDIINKKVSNETIIKSIETIYNAGFKSIKLYGMVGLPHETEDDLKETVKFLKILKSKVRNLKLVWGCSVFVPKAGTPFQWYGMDNDADRKLKYYSKELHQIGVDFRAESYRWAKIQALISRGDRSINKALVKAYRSGCRGKSRLAPTLGDFNKALREEKINADHFIFEKWEEKTKLPWDSLQGFLNKEVIEKHFTALKHGSVV